jgi:hypothetical protein
MADFGFVQNTLAGLTDSGPRKIFEAVFRYVLRDIRFGRGTSGEPSTNMGGGFFSGTTPSIANTEFSIVHTFGRTPYLVIPVLPLNQVNAKIVRLTLSKAADASRIYLKSPDTDAPVFLYLEG